ncbi:hypothetical protein BJ165DRAFT_1597501 [Panaeolus papilionaceus]|nr:hypothetical protein BJ165DRAFT_1597501 [Panaeolus papilionaceus]
MGNIANPEPGSVKEFVDEDVMEKRRLEWEKQQVSWEQEWEESTRKWKKERAEWEEQRKVWCFVHVPENDSLAGSGSRKATKHTGVEIRPNKTGKTAPSHPIDSFDEQLKVLRQHSKLVHAEFVAEREIKKSIHGKLEYEVLDLKRRVEEVGVENFIFVGAPKDPTKASSYNQVHFQGIFDGFDPTKARGYKYDRSRMMKFPSVDKNGRNIRDERLKLYIFNEMQRVQNLLDVTEDERKRNEAKLQNDIENIHQSLNQMDQMMSTLGSFQRADAISESKGCEAKAIAEKLRVEKARVAYPAGSLTQADKMELDRTEFAFWMGLLMEGRNRSSETKYTITKAWTPETPVNARVHFRIQTLFHGLVWSITRENMRIVGLERRPHVGRMFGESRNIN